MRRTVLFVVAGCALAQSPRDAYRRDYQAWRETEPTLESEAAAGDLTVRTQRAAAAAKAYVASRSEFLDGVSREAAEQMKRIQDLRPPAAIADTSPEVQTSVTIAGEVATRVAESFGTTGDALIRQLRTALQQERAALDAITQAMTTTRRSATAMTNASLDFEEVQRELLRGYQSVVTARTQSADQMRKSGTAWEAYYQALANPVAVSSNAAAPAKPLTASPKTGASPAASADVVRATTITPLPLVRYTGDWTFPANGIYFGTQPQSVEFTVRESGGRLTGTLNARFLLPAGNAANPVVQLTFEGALTANRNQTFEMLTSDGLAGSIELIPGPAFNLLEVNFQLGLVPNRIRHGNVLLVKR